MSDRAPHQESVHARARGNPLVNPGDGPAR